MHRRGIQGNQVDRDDHGRRSPDIFLSYLTPCVEGKGAFGRLLVTPRPVGDRGKVDIIPIQSVGHLVNWTGDNLQSPVHVHFLFGPGDEYGQSARLPQ